MHVKKQKSLLTLFLVGMVSIIIPLSLVHFGELFYFRVQKYNKEVARLNETQLIKQKEVIKREVDAAIEYIRFQNEQMTVFAKEHLKKRVHEAHQIASSLYRRYEGQKSHLEILELVRVALRDIRFNNDRGYFFALKMNGILELYPIQPRLEGINWLNSPQRKQHPAAKLIALAQQNGEGFYEYKWPKPGYGAHLFSKLSYIKYFAPADWIIGTGEYLDDLNQEIKSAAKDWLQSVRFGSDGFLFALDYNSAMLAHAEPKLIGNRMLDSQFPQIRAAFPQMLTKSEHTGAFVEYQFRRPQQKSMSRKVSYVAQLSEWRWIIGAGFYLDSLEAAIQIQSEQLQKALIIDFIQRGTVLLLAILLAALFVKVGSKRLQQNINVFNKFFSRAASQSICIEKSEVIFKEFDQMAEAINTMVKERDSIEQDRKQLENQLMQRQKMESLGTLAGGIAHDFNNLLTGIFGNLALLSFRVKQESIEQKYIDRIEEAASRAKDLVTQILSFTRYSEAQKKVVDLNQVVKEALEILRSSIPTTVTIKADLQKSTLPLRGDRTQLHQVVMNICNNAFQALPQQTGNIHISLTVLTKGEYEKRLSPVSIESDKIALLRIHDDGVGIPKEIIDKIYDPFFSTKEKGKGTGLGLSIVHRVVNQYGGSLELESEVGKGTSFYIFLPLVSDHGEEIAEPESMEVFRGSGTVLFVDDDKGILESVSEFLEHIGYTVIAVSSAAAALEYLVEHKDGIQAMITDQTMPTMTGLELIKKIRETTPDLPIILCTGFSEQVNEETLQNMNLAGFLMKPVSLPELSSILKNCI